jgi:hypothetical protein
MAGKEKPRLAPGHIEMILKKRKQHNTTTAAGTRVGQSEIQLTQREKTVLGAIQKEPEAKRNFDFLVRKTGCSIEFLTTYFVQEAWGPETIHGIDSEHFDSEQFAKLRRFAESLKRTATRMQEMNQMPDWKFAVPRIGLVDTVPSQVEDAFRSLPDLLLLYARNIDAKVGAVSKGNENPGRKTLELVFAEELAQWLQTKTRHRYRERVASIQRVTYGMAGRNQLPASGETLRKRDRRKKKQPFPK